VEGKEGRGRGDRTKSHSGKWEITYNCRRPMIEIERGPMHPARLGFKKRGRRIKVGVRDRDRDRVRARARARAKVRVRWASGRTGC
jgi:hypothetical protein